MAATVPIDATLAVVLASHRPIGNEEPLLRAAGRFAATPRALDDWAMHAGAGQVCVFARAPAAPPAVAKQSRVLAARGLVTLRQGRSPIAPELFDYMARRTDLPFAQARPAPCAMPLPPVARLLLTALAQVADAGMPCLTNAQLAAIVGERSADRVSRLIRQLVAAQAIAVQIDPIRGRTIEILDSGARTAPGSAS